MTAFDPSEYGREIADLYDQLYPASVEIAQVAQALQQLSPDGTLLELGVGTGRMALGLAESGLDVHGLEISPEMIERLRAQDPEAAVTVHEGDMRTFDLGRTYGVVALFSDGLYALPTQEDQIACIGSAAKHLGPEGRLVVETTWPGLVQRHESGAPAAINPYADGSVMITTPYHKPLQQVSLYLHLVVGAQQRTVKELFRAVWPSELDLMARLADLELDARWADWAGAPVQDPARIISVYRAAAEPRS